MPRPPRIHVENGIYHAMTRGDGGKCIFENKEDYLHLLHSLQRVKARFQFRLYAYCLMPNHLHLLLRVAQKPIYDIMQSLLTSYAKDFNFRRKRWGHVFQERYKEIFCVDDAYFLELLRYIHLNPVRAGVVSRPEEWPWSGHDELSKDKRGGLIDVGFPLDMFSPCRQNAITLYDHFLAAGMNPRFDAEMPAPSQGRIAPMVPKDTSSDTILPQTIDEGTWQTIGCKIAAANGIQLCDLLGARRTRMISRARHILIRELVAGGIRPSHVAKLLNLSTALITKVTR